MAKIGGRAGLEPGVLVPTRPAPAGVPSEFREDAHVSQPPRGDLAGRREALLAHVAACPTPGSLAAVFHELGRLAAGGPAHVGLFEAALDYVDARVDCADFVMHGVLRLLLQFGEDPRLPAGLLRRARESVLGFKYWPDEPGIDSLCSWTENHQILFAAAAHLAGEHHPDATFANSGLSGRELAGAARPRILRWLELRFRTGFSEWLSNCYYDEDLTALTSLVELSADEEIRRRSELVLDLVLFDMVLHHYQGVFASTHGRSYGPMKKWAAAEATADTYKLLFGLGSFARRENMSAVCLALTPRYRVPAVLGAIAHDTAREETMVRQRGGIRVDEAERWGLDPGRLEDAMTLLSLEAYTHPRTIDTFVRMLDAWGWWENEFFAPFRAARDGIRQLVSQGRLAAFAREMAHDIARNLREEVNLVTYRTPDYQLSSAQDWRPGTGGDQQHLWQATLGPDAACFTTHPGPRDAQGTPDWWTGSASLPRVAQVENVALVLYGIEQRPALYVENRNHFTHAWLPRDRFDEVLERDGWIFARLGDGYLALRSQNPYRWQTEPGEDRGREILADGADQVWICELGRRACEGSFSRFAERIARARLRLERRHVVYDSPSQGSLELGWNGPLRRAGEPLALGDYPRYDSPWSQAEFPSDEIEIRHGPHRLRLHWADARRESSGFL